MKRLPNHINFCLVGLLTAFAVNAAQTTPAASAPAVPAIPATTPVSPPAKPASPSAPAAAANTPTPSSTAKIAAAPEIQAVSEPTNPPIEAIYQHNVFDPKRKQWEEPRPPPPPPPPLPPITNQDVQVYGVIVMGSYKKAIVKLGGQFQAYAQKPAAGLPGKGNNNSTPQTPPKQFSMLTEGQHLGSYTLSEISANGLKFTGNGGAVSSTIVFTKKEDRQIAQNIPPPMPMMSNPFMPNAAGGMPTPFTPPPPPSPDTQPAPAISTPPPLPAPPSVPQPAAFNAPVVADSGAQVSAGTINTATNTGTNSNGNSADTATTPPPQIVRPVLPPGASLAETIQAYKDANGGKLPQSPNIFNRGK